MIVYQYGIWRVVPNPFTTDFQIFGETNQVPQKKFLNKNSKALSILAYGKCMTKPFQ